MELDRVRFTFNGWRAYRNHHLEIPEPFLPHPRKEKPYLVFSFWYSPPYDEAKKLMQDVKARVGGGKYPVGVSLFTRPMGDVKGDDFDYDPTQLDNFLGAAEATSTPVFINTSGMHWAEVVYAKSPLIRHLESRDENLMKFDDRTRVRRKLQPPAQYVPGFMRGHFGIDGNGVLYLSYHAPKVRHYRYKNLSQVANTVQSFAKRNPGIWLGISTENEIAFPGKWETDGRKAGYEEASEIERQRQSGLISVTFDEFRLSTIRKVLRENVEIFERAGIPNIYTNQSIEDAENRVSPLSTADILGSNIGVTAWGIGNEHLYKQAFEMSQRKNKSWALVITNPLSLDYESTLSELQIALQLNPDFIGLYNWWPHFWGYGIRGMALEKAIRALTRG